MVLSYRHIGPFSHTHPHKRYKTERPDSALRDYRAVLRGWNPHSPLPLLLSSPSLTPPPQVGPLHLFPWEPLPGADPLGDEQGGPLKWARPAGHGPETTGAPGTCECGARVQVALRSGPGRALNDWPAGN